MKRAVLALSLAFAASAAADEPLSADAALAQRWRGLGLDAACGGLSDAQRAALRSGAALARNALLRADWSAPDIEAIERAGAQAGRGVDCVSPEAAVEIERINGGFDGWRRLTAMTYPGAHRAWSARRPLADRGWAITQDISRTTADRVWFGVAIDPDGLARPALGVRAEARASVARLRLRDFSLSSAMLDAEIRRLAAGAETADPLQRAAPPEVFARLVPAADRTRHPAGDWYADGFGGAIDVFWFPEALLADIAALDPRESFTIEIDHGPRAPEPGTRAHYVEVGDFAPAYFFVAASNQAFAPLERSEEADEADAASGPPALR